jgi:hypothetical protein
MLLNYKIEWCYKNQETYQSYANTETLLQSLEFVQRLVKNQTDYNYDEIIAIRIELNGFLWISIIKDFLGKERYYLMCTDYDMGKLNTFHDIEILMKNFN